MHVSIAAGRFSSPIGRNKLYESCNFLVTQCIVGQPSGIQNLYVRSGAGVQAIGAASDRQ